ncbi:hypothetical protein PsorP6_000966 [Peronosclerospora sorghi]|uniref:Uncharacterized protein n=1 Tax=Peronosclerospora sorghi TaxID=230839 RepID=A0ACC0WS40_9STRA|nr:hypothetical protein PsorP6_000966 [Peronosclerospora sorghi]
MAWIQERFLQLIQPAGIVLQILGMLGIHGLEFALGGTGREQGRDEKLGKAIQRVRVVVTEHVKVVGLLILADPKSSALRYHVAMPPDVNAETVISTTPQVHVRNGNINAMKSDVLFHIGLTYSHEERRQVANTFGDVKFFIAGGSAERMTHFAHAVAQELNITSPYGYALCPIGSTSRYMLYKVGPVLVANHGIGMPSISILLHEITKLLEYAGVHDATYIRMGTSGGIDVEPGTVVITSEAVNNKMDSVDEVAVLGTTQLRPSVCSPKVLDEIVSAANEVGVPYAVGKTLSCNDFYEGQGRLDGAICEYTLEDKMAFLHKLANAGVRNIEMEARLMAGFCHKLNIPVAVVCVTLLNRLDGDQVLSSPETLQNFEKRLGAVVLHYIKTKLSKLASVSCS